MGAWVGARITIDVSVEISIFDGEVNFGKFYKMEPKRITSFSHRISNKLEMGFFACMGGARSEKGLAHFLVFMA